jgi:hypothetical protein
MGIKIVIQVWINQSNHSQMNPFVLPHLNIKNQEH